MGEREMSQNKSLQSKMPLAMGLAFVAFTTQFGGGFASGAQIYQYFINYGIWCLILPAVTQGLYALFFWYGMRYAYKHKTYDYRSFSDSLYGKTKPVMSNLYEICYLIMIGTASAAAFATGGSTLQTLFGIPYWLCTLIIAAFIFVIALFRNQCRKKMCFYIKCADHHRSCTGTCSEYHCTVGRYHSFHPYYVLRRNDCTFLRERSLWTGSLFSSPLFLLPAGICFCYVPAHGGCNGRKTDQQSSDLDVCMQFLCNGAFHPRTSCHCICK